MNLTKEIQKLKKEVQGHYSEIAEIANSSKAAVGYVLNGKYNNDDIIKAAIQVRDKIRKRDRDLLNKLKGK